MLRNKPQIKSFFSSWFIFYFNCLARGRGGSRRLHRYASCDRHDERHAYGRSCLMAAYSSANRVAEFGDRKRRP